MNVRLYLSPTMIVYSSPRVTVIKEVYTRKGNIVLHEPVSDHEDSPIFLRLPKGYLKAANLSVQQFNNQGDLLYEQDLRHAIDESLQRIKPGNYNSGSAVPSDCVLTGASEFTMFCRTTELDLIKVDLRAKDDRFLVTKAEYYPSTTEYKYIGRVVNTKSGILAVVISANQNDCDLGTIRLTATGIKDGPYWIIDKCGWVVQDQIGVSQLSMDNLETTVSYMSSMLIASDRTWIVPSIIYPSSHNSSEISLRLTSYSDGKSGLPTYIRGSFIDVPIGFTVQSMLEPIIKYLNANLG